MDKRRPSFARSLSLCTACNPANPLRHHPVAILCEVLGSVHWETQWSVRGRTLCTVKISDRCQPGSIGVPGRKGFRSSRRPSFTQNAALGSWVLESTP